MAILNFIFYYFVKNWRQNRKRRRRRQKDLELKRRGKDVERNEGEDTVDGNSVDAEDDYEDIKRPLISNVILAWGALEILTLIVVLIRMSGAGHPDNFLRDFCTGSRDRCFKVVPRMMYYKILVSMLLIIGAKCRLVAFMVPWFVVNVLGLFPYWLLVFSAFHNFRDIYEQLEEVGQTHWLLTFLS